MISGKNKELYYTSSVDKQLNIEVVGTRIVIDNSMREQDTFTLAEALNDGSELKFGSCLPNQISFIAHDMPAGLVGKTLRPVETLEGNEDDPFTYGKYKIFSAVPTADRTKRQITAYDAMYDILNADVKAWYAGLSFPMALKQFRYSFFAYLGVEQEETTLVNDSMTVNKTLIASSSEDSSVTAEATISGKTIIEAICEINGAFGNMNRAGKFEYVILPSITSALYPEDDLYPRDDLFPSDANTESMTGHYFTFDYEDFQSKAITQLEIRADDNTAGAIVGNPGNTYVISGNFLVSDKTGAELEQIANNLLPIMAQAAYTPIKSCTTVGNPCLELGDPIRFNTSREIVETYLLQRTLTGVQSKRDSISAQGTQTHSAKVNSIRDTIESVERRTGKLERNADHLQSTYEDLEDQTSSKFEQTANAIAAEVTRAQGAENSLGSRITQTAESITAEVSKKVGEDEIRSKFAMSPENVTIESGSINFNSNTIGINSDNFGLDSYTGETKFYGEQTFYEDKSMSTSGRFGYGYIDGMSSPLGFYFNKNLYVNKNKVALESSPTLSNATLTGNIDAIGIKGRSSSASANVRCQDGSSTGYLAIAATSSQRYKHDITDITDPKLDPHNLLRLHARQYKYNLDYLDPEDTRYDEVVCGFVAEEVLKQYPVACEFNAYGMPENWDARYIIPPMLALIQEQHGEIEQLKSDNFSLKGEVDILKQRLEKMEEMLNVINSKIN